MEFRSGPTFVARPLDVPALQHGQPSAVAHEEAALLDRILAEQSRERKAGGRTLATKGNATTHETNQEDQDPDEDESENRQPAGPTGEGMSQLGISSEPSARSAALAKALKQKTEQLKRMGIMLEAMSPLPGVSAERLLNAIDNVGPVDARDQKIVQLARKCRNLSVALQREREESRRMHEQVSAMKADSEALPKEQSNESQKKQTDGDKRPSRREQHLAKQVAELRLQLQHARDDTVALRRALAKEVGDDFDEKLQDDGWRGRAQQIIMLKARIKKLENELADGAIRQRTQARCDVDEQAQRDLREMERERQRAVEQLTERHAGLQAELHEARKKIDAGRARAESLLSDLSRNKEHVRLLLDKTQSDNELIDALRSQVTQLQAKLREARTHRGENFGLRDGHVEVDLARLRRENAHLQLLLEKRNNELAQFAAVASTRVDQSPSPPTTLADGSFDDNSAPS